jgi:hypothetical protein
MSLGQRSEPIQPLPHASWGFRDPWWGFDQLTHARSRDGPVADARNSLLAIINRQPVQLKSID